MRILLMFTIAATLAAQTPSKGNAENGKKLFTTYGCYQCHGREGQGGAAGPRLAPKPVPLVALNAYVRHPSGEMPPYTAKVASDADLADIHAFLGTIKAPAAVDSIPLLKQ
jgi:ubiquinol-cytochrome c reductase cytochrome c subunit